MPLPAVIYCDGGSYESQPKRKRNRTLEMYSMTERLDRASLLDESVSYVKALQMHANALQITGGGVCMLPSPNACYRMPHMSPFLPMGMGYHAMGMGYPVGHATYRSTLPPPVRQVVGHSAYPSFYSLSQQAVPFSTVAEYTTFIPSPPILQPGPFGL